MKLSPESNSTEMNKLVLEHMNEGILMLNKSGFIEAFNPAVLKIFDLSEADFFKKSRNDLFQYCFKENGDLMAHDEFPSIQVEKTGKPVVNYPIMIQKQDQVIIHIRVNATPIFNDSGVHVRTLLTIENINEYKKMEKEIKEKEALIFHSAKLTSLGEMSAGIAHEINNPLSIILGRIELLKRIIKTLAPENILEQLNLVEANGFRIERIVKSMAFLSRKNDYTTKVFESFESLLEDVKNICNESFKKLKINITFSVEPEILIENYQGQMAQVLINLLNNSKDAIRHQKEKWVHIEAKHLDDKLNISITDSGPGISKEIQKKLMTPFFTTKPPGEGTGLGLSISRKIVNIHGGELILDTECKNTRFIIRLPKSNSN